MTITGNNMPLKYKIFLIIIALVLILFIVYAISIIPKQIKFIDKCESICKDKNMTYETTFFSYPNAVNGKCYCINKTLEEIK